MARAFLWELFEKRSGYVRSVFCSSTCTIGRFRVCARQERDICTTDRYRAVLTHGLRSLQQLLILTGIFLLASKLGRITRGAEPGRRHAPSAQPLTLARAARTVLGCVCIAERPRTCAGRGLWNATLVRAVSYCRAFNGSSRAAERSAVGSGVSTR